MPDAYAVLWTKDYCRWLRRAKDRGPLSVIFGGPHQSQPSIRHVAPGDSVFPVAVENGALLVVAGMKVERLLSPDQFVADTLGYSLPRATMWDEAFQTLKRARPDFGHRIPHTCADLAAAGSGTAIRFDCPLPLDQLLRLRLGPHPGREQPLQGLTPDGISESDSFRGHVRRLSQDSAALLGTLVFGADALHGKVSVS
jgi:hypothetical protein